jgi:hypothetical protein
MQIPAWHDRDPETQREDYEKQALAWRYRELCKDWMRLYTGLARALADAFGEDDVLDILEKEWWDQQYEIGLLWREQFDADPQVAFRAMFERWHDGPQSPTSGAYDVELDGNRWHLLMLCCWHKDVALEMGERTIGMTFCISDMAAVRGWCPRIEMRLPNHQFRGDPYCYQIRDLVEEANPRLDHWSKELSGKYGWRSMRRLGGAD